MAHEIRQETPPVSHSSRNVGTSNTSTEPRRSCFDYYIYLSILIGKIALVEKSMDIK